MNPALLRTATAIDVHAFETSEAFCPASATSVTTSSASVTAPDLCPDALQRPLMLACLPWSGEKPLAGHSDGDAAAHAVCDALLIASGLGEMGSIFGVDRPEFSGASGEEFLRETLRLVREAGYSVINISVQIIAQRPRFASRKEEAQARMSDIVGAPVSVAATTTDHLGFIGAGEGIAAIATALIYKSEA